MVARINARLRNVSRGNPGDTKAVAHGLFEMRVHHGPGYRLYCLRDGNAVVVLCGGTRAASAMTSNTPDGWLKTGAEHDRDV